MNKERINDLIDLLGEDLARLENTFVIRNNQQLANYLDNPSEWFNKQMLDREHYKQVLLREAKQQLKLLNHKTEKVFLLSYREVAKDQIEISEREIIAKNIPHEVREQIKQHKRFNAEQISSLANVALNAYSRQVQIVNALSTPDSLYDAVKNQMKQGIENGLKVVYKNGRKVTWKSYMEMNIRTTIHQEIANDQVDIGAQVGQIFYYVDGFADDAPDHAPYTKKVYYNNQANIPQEIQIFIQRNQIKSMQEIMGEPVYLTTRPNCRHNFHAIPLEDALGMSAKAIGEKYGFIKGKYKGSNYEKMQEQRYNERMIRKLKLKREELQQMSKTTGDRASFQANNVDALIRKWQGEQRKLIAENKEFLKRDYDRENAKVIKDDLGVRYDYKFKDGEPISKK